MQADLSAAKTELAGLKSGDPRQASLHAAVDDMEAQLKELMRAYDDLDDGGETIRAIQDQIREQAQTSRPSVDDLLAAMYPSPGPRPPASQPDPAAATAAAEHRIEAAVEAEQPSMPRPRPNRPTPDLEVFSASDFLSIVKG